MDMDQAEHSAFGIHDHDHGIYGSANYNGALMGAMGREVHYGASGMASSIHFQNVELIRIINDLKKKDTQIEAAKKLDQYMHQYQDDCDDNLFDQLRAMLASKNMEEKFGALMAINNVASIGRQTRIIHNVNKIMPSVVAQLGINNKELVEKAAYCLGILSKAGNNKITSGVVDHAFRTVIEYLKDTDGKGHNNNNSIKRYSGLLVIKEFCKRLRMITLNKVFDPIDESDGDPDKINLTLIFAALKDHRLHVRTTAADCINECIRMISQRETLFLSQRKDQQLTYLDLIYTQV